MGIVQEFKDFALKGNMMDMAIGIIIGGAFGGLVTTLAQKVILPPINAYAMSGDTSFLNKRITDKVDVKGEPYVMALGDFLGACLQFLILAIVIFMLVKAMNSMKKKEEAKPATPPKQEVLLTEIRDLLKK